MQEEAAPAAAVATFYDLRGVKGRGLQWAGGWGRGIAR